MPEASTGVAAPTFPRGGAERRRSRRRLVPRTLVGIEVPAKDGEQCWAGTALDINGDGMGVALPPDVERGDEVLLTFRLGGSEFRQVPGVVLRQEMAYGVGAIRFRRWPESARQPLLDYLLAN